MKNKKRRGIYSREELVYIKANSSNMTDKEIAANLGRPLEGITRKRKEMGFIKLPGRPSTKAKISEDDYENAEDKSSALSDLTRQERRSFASQTFHNSPDYKRFQNQFTDDEMIIFVARFSDYISEWKEVLPYEREQLYAAIIESLIKDRWRAQVKSDEEIKMCITKLDIERLTITQNPLKTPDDLERLEEIKKLIDEIRQSRQPIEYMWDQYHKSADRESKILKDLKMTRDQRLKDRDETELNIVTMVQKMNDVLEREKRGRQIALIQQETHNKKEEFKQKGMMHGDF